MNHKGIIEIETDRLILRGFKKEDAPLMFKNWANDERVTKYLRWTPHENVDLTYMLCEMWEKESKELNNYQWVIMYKENNEPIGSIGLVEVNEKKKAGEIGYCISYDYWGKGIVKEALDKIIEYLKPIGFARLQAFHDVENPNSGKVLTKCGFTCEGTLYKYELNNKNEFIDVLMYSKIFEDNL